MPSRVSGRVRFPLCDRSTKVSIRSPGFSRARENYRSTSTRQGQGVRFARRLIEKIRPGLGSINKYTEWKHKRVRSFYDGTRQIERKISNIHGSENHYSQQRKHIFGRVRVSDRYGSHCIVWKQWSAFLSFPDAASRDKYNLFHLSINR